MQVLSCRCTLAGALMQVFPCRCTHAGALMQIHVYIGVDAGTCVKTRRLPQMSFLRSNTPCFFKTGCLLVNLELANSLG